MTDIIELGKILRVLLANRKGVTALEYGMIAALIAAVIVGTISTLGGKLNAAFLAVSSAL